LPRLWLRQRYREFIIRRKHLRFRSSDNGEARTAYLAMGRDEFADINALQAWANWRTLPHNLSGRLPARPVFIVDLCCGLGQSTAVLAHYCPPGSFILGLEANPAFADAAGKRAYTHRDGGAASVAFHAQSVLEPFRDGEGRPVADASVDLVNAVGAIACHFQPDAADALVGECARVLRPEGFALLDAGREGTRPRELMAIAESRGLSYEGRARSCLLDRHWQLCFRRIGGDSRATRESMAMARTQTAQRTRSGPC
jgi:SAM-dependent methyltransferase